MSCLTWAFMPSGDQLRPCTAVIQRKPRYPLGALESLPHSCRRGAFTWRRPSWLKAAQRTHLGTPRHHPGGDGDRRQQQAHLARRADRGQARVPAPADLPRAPRPPRQGPAQRVHRGGLGRSPGRRAPAARQPARGRLGQPQVPRQRRDDRADRGPGLTDRLPAAAVCARAQSRRASVVTSEEIPGQTQPRSADRPGENPAQAEAVPARSPRRLPRRHRPGPQPLL